MFKAIVIIVVFITGTASQYSPGVMERTVWVRQHRRTSHPLPLDLPITDGYVAVLDCDAIGQVWYLRPSGSEHWESFLVADCAGSQATRNWMSRNNIFVEVDGKTAERWDTVDRGIEVEWFQYRRFVEGVSHRRRKDE